MHKSKNSKPIIVICGEPNSVFSELLAKSIKKFRNKKPIILIGSYELIHLQLKKLGYKIKLNRIGLKNDLLRNTNLDKINILDISYNFTKVFEPVSSKSNKYITECFQKAFRIIKKNKIFTLFAIYKSIFLCEHLSLNFFKSFNFNFSGLLSTKIAPVFFT